SATNYSVYLKGTSFTSVPEIHAGIDTGKNTKITAINYKNSGAKENVVIRTNGGTLTVDAANDTVNHYSNVDTVTVTSVAKYNEYGKVNATLDATSGSIEVKDNANVNVLKATGTTNVNITANAVVRSIEGSKDCIKSNPNNVIVVTEEKKNEVTTKINNSLLDAYKIYNVLDKGNYTEEDYLTKLQEKNLEKFKYFTLYYETSYKTNNEEVKTIEVDGLTYKENDKINYSVGKGAIINCRVFKVEGNTLWINKLTYLSSLTRKEIVKVNGKIISLVEDSYNADLSKKLAIEDVKDNTGNVTPVSSNEYNVVYKTGVSNRRVSIKINSLVSGDIAIIRKNRNGDVSYSIDSYNGPSNDDFGVYVYTVNSTAKLDDPKISQNAIM
ncbi:MAG: hypothetical protein SOU19_03520, partial [Candidatus Caccosoma sp.]|nr:hypothetical protein [Candidatus Caccosoma sp.]